MSITSDLNGQLQLICTFCVILLVGILLHRVLSILCKILLAGMLFLPDVSVIDEPLKKFAQKSLVASVMRFGVLVVVTVLQLCTVVLNVFFTILYILLPFVGLALMMVLMHERWSDSMMVLTDVLNGQVGSTLHQLVLAPLTIFDAVGTYVLPVFNLVVFVLIRIPVQILVWVLQGNGVSHLMHALTYVCAAASEFMAACKLFVNSNSQSCNTSPVCSDGECIMVDLVTQATACLHVASRELDFMPAFAKLQQTGIELNLFVADTCAFLAILGNVVTFPISDFEMWRALDRVLNAFLYALVSAPGLAISRCQLAGGFETRPAMCTPDFGPAFDKIAASGVHFGNALTNWLDAIYLFLFSVSDIRDVCAAATSLDTILWSDPVAIRLWGVNATVLTRMDDNAFAMSDGNSVIFVKKTAGQFRKTYSPNLWSVPVDPKNGIARTLLPSGLNNGLMGCTCNDVRGAVSLRCSIITQTGTVWDMPVRWSLSAETQLLTCDRIRIVVQSVRWPHRRVLANTLNANGEDTSKESTLNADVAIFVIPICGAADGFKAMACQPEKSFTRGICFPYCMALRMVHEGFAPITMRGAMEWQQGVLLAMRSCVPSTSGVSTSAMVRTTCTATEEGSATTDELTTCSYAYSCTTMIMNKSTVPGYRSEFPVKPKASWDGSHLLLMGQPLVVAGDVFMRMFASQDGHNYVDFPTVVGNQIGEFTVEANSPIGIPVTPPASVPKFNIEKEKKGEVFEPAGYVQFNVPYNPATLTPTAMWYASNPSYEWIQSMAIYCATEGHEVMTQIMLLSNYAPLRIWRVLYHDHENCVIVSQSGEHVCVPDIAVATSLEMQIQIMGSKALEGSTTLYDMCSSNVEFNLWVESMEPYDDLNIAVAVRRGSLADLGKWQKGIQSGKTVFYFFNTSNITQPPQAGEPFVAPQSGIMCPAFKVLPDVGAILGHSIATVSNLLRMPVNLALNPFAVAELLTSRGENKCPENSLGHSVLGSCGMNLLSLDDFFSELYITNDAVWNIGYWLLSTLIPQHAIDNSQEASVFRSFLQGALVVGDATKVVGTFDIIHAVEFMDTGIQGTLLGARRRLLGATSTIVNKLMSGLKSGFSSLLSLGQSVAGIASMQFSAGANFGVLISSQDATAQYAGAAVSAPSIAWAQFTYQASLPIVLDILGIVKQTGSVSITPVWMHLNDASDLFENIVQSHVSRACLGLRIMLGYSGSLGKALYYNCMAGQKMVNGMMTMSMTALVDIPLYRCLCVSAAGTDYAAYVRQHCMDIVPPRRRGFWQQIIEADTDMHVICTNYSMAIEAQLYGAFDEWKQQAIFSAESVASLLDNIFSPAADGYSGSCQNTLSNPGAFVLTPLPLSHYQICARTTACKERCKDANAIFEYEQKRLQLLGAAIDAATQPYNVLIESPLFNEYAPNPYVGELSVSTIVAIRTLPANSSVYGCQNRCRGTCVAVATRRATVISVMFFCLPDASMVLATIFSTNLDSFEISITPYTTDGGIIKAVDFSLTGVQLLLYIVKRTTSMALNGKTTSSQSHEVHACGDGVGCHRILRSEDFANGVLAPGNVQTVLFGSSQVVKPSVTNCLISTIVEIAGTGSVFFVTFTVDIKTWITEWVEATYSVHAIVKSSGSITFWPPCGSGCKEPTCGGTCHPKLEKVLTMAQTGTFLHIKDKSYLFVPTAGSATGGGHLYMQVVQIDASQGLLAVDVKQRFASTADNNLLTGHWTRGNIFSSISTHRQVRDIITHGAERSIPYFFQAADTFSARWLQEIRVSSSNSGLKLKAYISQESNQTAHATVKCSTLSCSGCASSNLRLLCHQAQNCALSRCLGTIVQTRNALCGVGGLIQQTLLQAITTWHAMFMIGAELAILVAKGVSGQSLSVVRACVFWVVLKFPTEQFYNMLCASKDMFAGVVGLGMSVGQVLSNMLSGKGLDLTGGQDIGVLVGEQSLKTASMGGFFFNCITGMTLLPILAMHRWVLCMADASLVSVEGVGISVKFGDVSMDPTWMQCAHMGSAFDVLNNNNVKLEIQSVVVMFVKFVTTLVLGLGETLLFGLELFWDSAIDFIIGLVFSVQDMLYTFNLRACKVPNYALRYVLWCSCQDDAYTIPTAQRAQKVGALWCVGSLSMTLVDGNVGIIYNPYSMNELSIGVKGVTDYISCLSEHSNPGECTPPHGQESRLQQLVEQGVEPIAVWARCKSNYVQGVWDIGAGALFSEDASGLDFLIERGQAWGNALGTEFMQCMREPSRLLVDYSTCMRLYFSLSANSTPGAYFLYEKSNSTEPPDACLVFSGLNASATANSTLQVLMNDCMLQDNTGMTQACELNPLIWSGKQPGKMPAASLHGTVPSNNTRAAYEPIIATFRRAIEEFEKLFVQQAKDIDATLFSADGDFIHDFFDCMYLGPYSRVNLMACDADGALDCPFYARDNMSGASRDFVACFGDAMNGDHVLPFTCGSKARRSLIKYFFRNFSRISDGSLSVNVSQKIKDATETILQNYTDPGSWGCWHSGLKKCTIEACAWENGYTPCLINSYEIASKDVSDLIVQTLLHVLPQYYTLSMQDSAPWTTYYDGGPPAQWRHDAASAAIAQQAGLFDVNKPTVTYGPEEVFNMPLASAPRAERVRGGMTWGLCTSLLAHTAMSLPLTSLGRPVGLDGAGDMNKLDDVMWLVQNITRHAMMEHTPYAWHKARRHAPSRSGVCAHETRFFTSGKKLNIGSVQIKTQGPMVQARVGEELTFPLYGYLQGQLGAADSTCICAESDPIVNGQCVMSTESCASLLAVASTLASPICSLLTDACRRLNGKYPRDKVPIARECLRSLGAGVRCPELGPSDWYGLFPVDCIDGECDVAKQWVTPNSIPYEGARFLNDGRAGMRLPNFKHVNNTFHQSIHYGHHSGENIAQPQCFDAPDLFPDFSPPEILARLFPAAQALFDSPTTAACTRFVVEVARAEAMGLISDNAGAIARVQATKWRRRCAAKIRQLVTLNVAGVFYDVPPPPIWPDLVDCGGITLTVDGAYLTPDCVVVDQQRRLMYDAHLCIALAHTGNIISSRELQLTAQCVLDPQPLDLVQGNVPLSMVYNKGMPLAPPISELTGAMNLDYVLAIGQNHEREHVSHVLDWWPDDSLRMPVGYHPTAASDPSEIAPALFDSHFVYDKSNYKAYYVHSGLRNGSLLYTTFGAAGICRSHSAAMPMFDANTNRICTRLSKTSGGDTPTMPVSTPLGTYGEAGPTFTPSFIETHYEAEHCATSHHDVPWTADADDFQSLSAGGILGWQHYVEMDSDGKTSYDLRQSGFPPDWYELSKLPEYNGWGTECDGVSWGAGLSCTLQCPKGTTCLATKDRGNVCFSTEAYTRSGGSRQPCFRTEHCADGLVCLADGGCSPLYVHVWNDGQNVWDMEATVLADQCGFLETVHPYTQSMRGASPWEKVPDLLHVHGMCSHHNWFSYRHAVKYGMCALQKSDVLRCNTSSTHWPWVQERFDGQSASITSESMATANTLRTQADPCDVAFMHLQSPITKKRMQVCSGFNGQEADPVTAGYLHYELQDGAWMGATMESRRVTDTTRWLRTYQESTDEAHISLAMSEKNYDVPLGFLGADRQATGISGEMAVGDVDFFRCADRLACNNPPFTYNGVAVAYRLLPDGANMSETSLRRCGSIGYLKMDMCTLDIDLFPLFFSAIWSTPCTDMWPNYASANSGWLVMTLESMTAANLVSGMLYCSSMQQCVYAPRASSRLEPSHQSDGIAQIIGKLNDVLRFVGKNILSKGAVSVTNVYESINRCIASVTDTLLRSQSQSHYNTLGSSGVYFAFSLTLYEIPLAWLHHCMLVTLLSRIDSSVSAPALHRMGTQGSIYVDLWGPERLSACEDSERLQTQSVLWQIICQNSHPVYTFSNDAGADLVSQIEEVASDAIIGSMLVADESEEVNIYCYGSASWPNPCVGACKDALNMAFNKTHCETNLGDGVCAHPERFKFENLQKVKIDDPRISTAAVNQVNVFMQRAKVALLENLQEIATKVDYIKLANADNLETVPIVSLTPMDATELVSRVTSDFDLEKWLKIDVCQSVFDETSICKDQTATTLNDECLYQNALDRQDMDRYLLRRPPFLNGTTTDPVVVITYAPNADGNVLQDRIPICKLIGTEPCIVQHFADSGQLQEDTMHVVSCDITRIEAPPGVEIQAFAMQAQPYQTWQQLIDNEYSSTTGAPPKWCSTRGSDWDKLISPVQSCTWQGSGQYGPDVWVGSNLNFETIDVAFEDVDSTWNTPESGYASLWQNVGCGEFAGFCSFRIRMENKPGLAVGVCENSRVPPNCASYINSKMSTFRMCSHMRENEQQLYRCSPCTKYTPIIKESGGLFDCYASSDEGVTREPQITRESISQTLQVLENGLEQKLTMPPDSKVQANAINVALKPLLGESKWGLRVGDLARSCTKSACWSDFNSDAAADHNMIIWDKAVNNPGLQFTMICSEQPYTEDDQRRCNPFFDKRRQAIAQFVEQQYRQTNGVWMPSIKAGTGLGWRANVAHSAVGMFSIMYASAERAERDKLLSHVLGQSICGESSSAIQDRICVGSKQSNAFEPAHPWLGGDFNPFEGLDECPVSTGNSLCQCSCSPLSVCKNYAADVLASEFPNRETCSRQAFPRWRTMQADDVSNLCAIIKNTATSKACLHPQGLLGGGGGGDESIDTTDLHGFGIPTQSTDFLKQTLLNVADNGLWAGQTMLQTAQAGEKYGFLKMPREHLHPAHIAFGIDLSATGVPLIVKGISLLPFESGYAFKGTGASWVKTLKQQWDEDHIWISTLYPDGLQRRHWSCPFRAFAFWGGESSTFAPITPDPLLMRTLFQQRAHPFIKAKSLRHLLAKYETTNGACFYQKQAGAWRVQISVNDADNQCGLHGMVRGLNGGIPVLSRVVNRFNERCNSVLDDPLRTGPVFRSGETFPMDDTEQECGVLHRLTPFLMRTKGDGGPIKVLPLDTRSEGGDCHMGRAFLFQNNLIGRQCALSFKNKTHGISLCPRAPELTPLQRVLPQSLEQVLFKKANRLYRNKFTTPVISFTGPGGVSLQDPESSFGLLYSVPLAGALYADLLQTCAATPGCARTQDFTWNRYFTKGGLVDSPDSTAPGLLVDPTIAQANTRIAQHKAGTETDASLWNSPNWTWTFQTEGFAAQQSRGTVDHTRWLTDRFGACNASYYQYGRMTNTESKVRSISLCEPAPTGALQTLCRAMATFRSDISNVNCQVMGGGVCLHKPGMFYLPYMWSTTNQEFIADTVLEYYTEIVQQPRFAPHNMTGLCPARNTLLSHIEQLSLRQRDLCPGYQIEYLKTVLKTLKLIGHDLLYMGFCTVMGGVNLIGSVFAVDPGAATAMAKIAVHYVQEAIATAVNVIMPLLNTIVDVLFGTSAAGKVIKNIIEVLCEMWNFTIEYIVKPYWCIYLRPYLGGILKLISVMIRAFDKQTADNLDSFISAVIGGNLEDVNACLGTINVHIPCSMAEDADNGTFFPNAPMATRCWIDSSHSYYTAGGSVLAGTTTTSFLACSMSDTCAVEPLRFDDYDSKTDLVPCISCPAVSIADNGQSFGCNSYLKRCACGVRTQKPADCTRNSDCQSVICSVTANIDFARDSVTSVPCEQCATLGAEPVCVLDGAAPTGVCSCTSVRQRLHSCDNVGQSISVLHTGGECLAMTSGDQLGTTQLSFSELAIAPCALGSGGVCALVSLPMSSGGAHTTPLAVLTGLLGGSLNLISIMGRRLLEEVRTVYLNDASYV